jgi:ribosomal protein S12 methylthiotransferase
VFFDPRDIGVGRVVAHFVVDVDLVDHCCRELALLERHEQRAVAVIGRARPVDHHGDTGGLEPPAQRLGLQLRPFAELGQTVAFAELLRRGLVDELDATIDTARCAGPILGCTRRTPEGGFVCHPDTMARMPAARFHVETLGCPKNVVDSDKVVASLVADGMEPAGAVSDADLVVVNTCAFIEAARQESIDTALALADARKKGARLVVTGCMAERYGDELARALPEADAVVGFANEGELAHVVLHGRKPTGVRDLLELPRPAPKAPWAYVKIAEGCDRSCAFCAIPSFRGTQRSRTPESIVAEARALVDQGVAEIVLVAQDLAWYGRDAGAVGALAPLLRELDALHEHGLQRIRCLYLYPSEVRDPLVATMLELETVLPYFDLSLQHASPVLLRRMKRWGSADRFLRILERIRNDAPAAAFRSSFIVGFPGERETDHEQLLAFLADARLDWAGFFPFSREDGTTAARMRNIVPDVLVHERLRECAEVQDPITAAHRAALLGTDIDVLIDGSGDDGELVGRTYREAPEIDGVVRIDGDNQMYARPGAVVCATVCGVEGADIDAKVSE